MLLRNSLFSFLRLRRMQEGPSPASHRTNISLPNAHLCLDTGSCMVQSSYPTAAEKSGETPLVPSPSPACQHHRYSRAGQNEHPRHDLCFQDICLCRRDALFSPVCRFLFGHSATWVSFVSALCMCCWAVLPLPEPPPVWRNAGAPGVLGTPCAFTGVSV